MDQTCKAFMDDLLKILTEGLSVEEILSAKVLADISTQIANERIARGMNQNEFAELMGTTQAVVSKWESSERNFTIKKLVEIACKLNLDLDVTFNKIKSKEQLKQDGNKIIHLMDYQKENQWIVQTSSNSHWTEDEELKQM